MVEEEIAVGQKKRSQKDLRNVFFKKYREIKAACDDAILERTMQAEEYYESFDWFVRFMSDKDPDDFIREMEKTTGMTEAILCRIDQALQEYAEQCKSESVQSWRQYDAVYSVYFSSQRTKISELSRKFGVKKSTVYEDVKVAKTRINSILFGDVDDDPKKNLVGK